MYDVKRQSTVLDNGITVISDMPPTSTEPPLA